MANGVKLLLAVARRTSRTDREPDLHLDCLSLVHRLFMPDYVVSVDKYYGADRAPLPGCRSCGGMGIHYNPTPRGVVYLLTASQPCFK